jgi:hypothetical protein
MTAIVRKSAAMAEAESLTGGARAVRQAAGWLERSDETKLFHDRKDHRMKIPALLIACALGGGLAIAQTTPATPATAATPATPAVAATAGTKATAATPATPATAATPAAASVKADAGTSVTTKKATAKAKTTTKAKAKTKKTTQTMGAGAMAPVTDLQAPAREARINEAYARWQAGAR